MARTSLSNSHLKLNPSRNIAHAQNTVLVGDVIAFDKYNAVFAQKGRKLAVDLVEMML